MIEAIDTSKTTLTNGNWYAFELDGRRFFAIVEMNFFTGFMKLTEIPDPYICKVCGERYQAGEHGIGKPETHEFEPRGAPES